MLVEAVADSELALELRGDAAGVPGPILAGPIVAQRTVPVLDDDDENSLHERIKVEERAMLVDVIGRMAREGWTVTGRKVTLP